jgi:Cu-Zn family superoxide dismutase
MGVVHDLEPGSVHGFHIHQNGSTGNKCMDAGGHYNPLSTTHGGPTDETRHVGDLGNIRADRNGEAKIRIIDSMALLHGPYSILNRSIVIHQKADDLGKADTEDSTKTGSAGPRIFCGIIRKV